MSVCSEVRCPQALCSRAATAWGVCKFDATQCYTYTYILHLQLTYVCMVRCATQTLFLGAF